jgi:hypothetical protein
MKLVIVETPYAGANGGTDWAHDDVQRNLRYLRACMRDCLLRGEAPYASHALYTQPGVLRDAVAEERALGIRAGFAWRLAAASTVFYLDLGESRGMTAGREHAIKLGHSIAERRLGGEW